jgi:signal peptidase I
MGARGWIILVAALVVMGLALFAIDFPRPASDDMAPGIRKGDLLLACRVCGRPQRGDVVLFSAPDGPLTIRRVVAVPGDRVEVRHGVALVNGKELEATEAGSVKLDGVDPVSKQPKPFTAFVEKNGEHEYQVIRDIDVISRSDRPAEMLGDSYFVLADRRTLVRDSRDYGAIPRASIRSIALRILSTGDHDDARQKAIR